MMRSLLTIIRRSLILRRGLREGLPIPRANDEPIPLFEQWFEEARQSGFLLPESMCLATATSEGVPSARMVLLKGVDAQGFVFFTNYQSRKAAELDATSRAAVVFHWDVLQRQVRVEGEIERISPQESDAYFASRPRGAQIGAHASAQSSTLNAREDLERAITDLTDHFRDTEVPRPAFWGGYRVRPTRMEFWQGRPNRVHDRVVFERTQHDQPWQARLLYP